MPITLEQYTGACNYPGFLDEAAVENHLLAYLKALGITRNVVRLRRGWQLADYPSLNRTVACISLAARAARDALAAQDARDARAALDARAARAAQDARDALAARDASKSLAIWCVLGGGWHAYWDLSWIATTYFGAVQLKSKRAIAWAEPVADAFVAGCWLLYWTDDTLYWLAKPTLHMDQTPGVRRLHKADGPAFVCDIEDAHFRRGVLIPSEWIEKPETLDAKTALTWPNLEQRRIACSELLGWSKILTELGARVIDADPDPQIGTLVEVTLPYLERPARFLRVQCGTGREFALGIGHQCQTALEAQAWVAGIASRKFRKPEIRT